jgi:4-amino-4-deoxy-L-arabinose transferase-like glycosyltransferase
VVLWYGLAYRAGGHAFVAKQLVAENFDRFVGLGPFAHNRAHHPLKLVTAFLITLLPWNLAIGAERGTGVHPERAAVRFLHAWWIGVLAFFSIAAGKRAVYLLPLYPAVAVLAARWLERRVPATSTWVPVAMLALALTMAGVTQGSRLVAARANPLVPFAATARRLLPAEVSLFATPAVPENDVIVLAYLLDRPIVRARPPCTPGDGWLVPSEERVAPVGAGATLLAAAGRGRTALVTCR